MRESIDEPSELQSAWRKKRAGNFAHSTAARRGKVIAFLKGRPEGATAEEVIAATGHGVGSAGKFAYWKKVDGVTRHFLNLKAWEKFLNHG